MHSTPIDYLAPEGLRDIEMTLYVCMSLCVCVSVCLCVRPMKTSMRNISVIYTATFLQPLLILSQRSQEPYSTMVER